MLSLDRCFHVTVRRKIVPIELETRLNDNAAGIAALPFEDAVTQIATQIVRVLAVSAGLFYLDTHGAEPSAAYSCST